MNILYLSRWFPIPVNNGSKLRVHNLLTNLSEHNNVSLLSFYDQSMENGDSPPIISGIENIQVVPWKPYDAKSRSALVGFLKSTPRFLIDTYSSQMQKKINEYLHNQGFDLIIASELSMASYYPDFFNTPAIFDDLELGNFHNSSSTSTNYLKTFRHRLTWIKLKRYLSLLLRSFSVCTVVSEKERLLFLEAFPEHASKVEVVPNCVDLKAYQNSHGNPKPDQIIFTGSFNYRPNYEAMIWFIENAFPAVLEHKPEVQLVITGDPAGLPLPNKKNITQTGFVQDIKPLIKSSWISIAPLLNGGGTRLKILESMALNTPVVSTSKGAEGLETEHGKNILIADDPEEFARNILLLLETPSLHEQISTAGNQLVSTKYSAEVMGKKYQDLLSRHFTGSNAIS